jgi:hypothetical protein
LANELLAKVSEGCQKLKYHVFIAFLAIVVAVAQEKTTIRQTPDFAAVIHAATQTKAVPFSYSPTDVKVIGDLQFGRSSGAVNYSTRPQYRAFVFSAYGGETVKISVKGAGRKAFVALTDSTMAQLASGPETVSLSLPYRGPYIECWYVIFRDYQNKPARFTVQVNKLGTTAVNTPARTSATATN